MVAATQIVRFLFVIIPYLMSFKMFDLSCSLKNVGSPVVLLVKLAKAKALVLAVTFS